MIFDYILASLEQIAVDLDVEFEGDLETYDYDWVKERFNKKITPFTLNLNSTNVRQDTITRVSRYTIYMLPFAKDLHLIEEIINELIDNYFGKTDIGNITFIEKKKGFPFSEGSGAIKKRIEYALTFEITEFGNYKSSKDVLIYVGGYELDWKSFKITHGKASVLNDSNVVNDVNNKHINNTEIIIEAFIDDNLLDLGLIQSGELNKVNKEYDLVFEVGGDSLINGSYEFVGYTISNTVDNVLTAYLFFNTPTPKRTIKIKDVLIPIIDMSFELVVMTEAQSSRNILKEIYIGRARGYNFNISKSTKLIDGITAEQFFIDELLENDNKPLYAVEITVGDKVYNKSLMLKGLKEENSEIFSISFGEGSDL